MKNSPTNLDLDDAKTFVPSLHHLIDESGIQNHLNGEDRAEILAELNHVPESITIPLVRELRAGACELIRAEYTTVMAYHACRPVDYNQYSKYGVLRTSRELLSDLTKEAFWQVPNLDEIFTPVCDKYLDWYDGTIGLFLTAHEQTSWYKCPCFLEKMANALGDEGKLYLHNYLVLRRFLWWDGFSGVEK